MRSVLLPCALSFAGVSAAVACFAHAASLPSPPDPEARALAARWVAEPPSSEALETQWAQADRDARLRLAGAAMYWEAPPARALLRRALDAGLAAERPELQQVYLWRSFDAGVLPTDAELADLAGAARRAFSARLATSWMPPADAVLRALESELLRRELLVALLRTPVAAVASGNPDLTDWRIVARHAWTLHGAYFAPPKDPTTTYATVLGDFAHRSLTFGERDAFQLALKRLALEIPGEALRGAWFAAEDAGAREHLIEVALLARAEAAWPILLELAVDLEQPRKHRVRATRRAWRSDPERASPALRGLIAADEEESVLQTVLYELHRYATPEDLAVLESQLDAFQGSALQAALEVLAIHGDARQRRLWRDLLDRVPEPLRAGLPRAAMHADPGGGTEALMWEWLAGEDPQKQALAARTLSDFRSEEEIVAHVAERIEASEDPAARRRLAEQLYRVRPRASLPTLSAWLAGVEDLHDPLVEQVAILLVTEDAGDAVFDAWWTDAEVPEHPHRLLAAMARADRDAEARRLLAERFDEVDDNWKLGIVFMARDGAGPDEWRRFAQWAMDDALHHEIRRQCVFALADDLPESREMLLECLAGMRVALAEADAAPRVLLPLITRSVEDGGEELRSAARACVAAAESAGLDPDGRLRMGFRQAYWRTASVEERRALMEDVVAELARPLPEERPHTREAALSTLREAFPEFHEQARDLAIGPPAELDAELAARLRAQRWVWHRDRLWLLQSGAAGWDATRTAAREILEDTEPPGSRRVPRDVRDGAAAGDLPPRLRVDSVEVQAEIERLTASGDGEAAWALAEYARLRFPGDARLHNLRGWAAIAAGHHAEAEAAFATAKDLIGTLPDNHLESDLGLGVLRWLRDGERDALDRALQRHPQAARLLSAHLPVEAVPRLEALMPEDEEAAAGASADHERE